MAPGSRDKIGPTGAPGVYFAFGQHVARGLTAGGGCPRDNGQHEQRELG